MALWRLFDASVLVAPPVDASRLSGLLKLPVGHFLPKGAKALTRPFLGQVRGPFSSRLVAVPNDQVRMRIVGIGSGLVNRRKP